MRQIFEVHSCVPLPVWNYVFVYAANEVGKWYVYTLWAIHMRVILICIFKNPRTWHTQTIVVKGENPILCADSEDIPNTIYSSIRIVMHVSLCSSICFVIHVTLCSSICIILHVSLVTHICIVMHVSLVAYICIVIHVSLIASIVLFDCSMSVK